MLRPLSLALLALAACPDFDGAYERCVNDLPPRCYESAGVTFELRLFAFDDPRGATFELTPAGSGCGPGCFRYLEGTSVTVRPVAAPGARFVEWAGGCAGTSPECTVVMERDLYVRARVERLGVAFVTSSDVVVPSLGGLAGADQFCVAHARDAGLDGDFVAWLSTTAQPAGARLDGGAGWVTTLGEPVALSFDDLVSAGLGRFFTPEGRSIIHPISRDERGRHRSTLVATGTAENGSASFRAPGPLQPPTLQTCGELLDANRSITAGHSTATRGLWTDAVVRSCLSALPLYCFELPAAVSPLAPVKRPGKRAFVTPATVKGDFGGEAFADARCDDAARAAGWTGSFGWRPRGEGPWYRRDGVRVLSSADAGLDAPVMFPPDPEDDGLSFGDDVWVGGPLGDCNGWTSASSSFDGEVLPATAARADGLELEGLACSLGANLMCFER